MTLRDAKNLKEGDTVRIIHDEQSYGLHSDGDWNDERRDAVNRVASITRKMSSDVGIHYSVDNDGCNYFWFGTSFQLVKCNKFRSI